MGSVNTGNLLTAVVERQCCFMKYELNLYTCN